MAIRKFSKASIKTGTKSSKFWDQETFPNDYESIASISVTSAQSSVEFSNIPQIYAHLQLRVIWGLTDTGNNTWLNTQFNGDTTSGNYAYHSMRSTPGFGSTIGVSSSSSSHRLSLGADNLGNSLSYGVSIADILNYSSSAKKKTTKAVAGQDTNGVGTVNVWSGFWNSTAPITSMLIFTDSSTFRANSTFNLYGLRG